ncbi:hypothetical protein [Massilia endophytica]|uniref:hypothetical protein n=1 Tax=Massilia endophytica TaxID=2899220 RepID=UPI001E3F986B|nr:hypothetical protein [Massilia endophytica]UGQ48221.1 hypothetical protein LSQ66_07090 [Massilia endophytica]
MKKQLLAASLLALSTAAFAQDVGVSISVGQPGFYGRLDIGNMAPPPVIYAEPVIVQRPARYIAEPIYLRVPPGHEKNWRKHCHRYNACGRNVYFVRDSWYLNDYAPRYREEHERHGGGRGHDKHDKHEKHGGHGHGKGHGKGHD